MKAILKLMLLIVFISAAFISYGQSPNPKLLNGPWKAFWVTVPTESTKDYGVYYFRKNIDLKDKPNSFIIHVSADNRYKLYVNQTLVSLGPARGDTYYWNYETVDLAPYLKAGNNNISAVVWNDGDYRPEAQISIQTGFIMQGDSEAEALINTDKSWRCIRNTAYKPIVGVGYGTYYVAGPGERLDMNLSIDNWNAVKFDDSSWKNAVKIDNGNPKGTVNAFGWMLVPSSIPPMEVCRKLSRQ
jgi:alpha-L-rhamnosidase